MQGAASSFWQTSPCTFPSREILNCLCQRSWVRRVLCFLGSAVGWEGSLQLLVGYTPYKHLGSVLNCTHGQDVQGPPVAWASGCWSHGLLSGHPQIGAATKQNALLSSFWLLLESARQCWLPSCSDCPLPPSHLWVGRGVQRGARQNL